MKKVFILLLIFIFNIQTMAAATNTEQIIKSSGLTDEDIIIGFGVTIFPFLGNPPTIIKCTYSGNKQICRETYSDETLMFYRKKIEEAGLLKPGDKPSAIFQRMEEQNKMNKIKKEKEKQIKLKKMKQDFYTL